MPKFASYNRALKFSMSNSTNLLEQLAHSSHAITRGGGEGADHTFRGVAADALQDEGRDEEANLLRNPEQHVVVHEGKVKPAWYSSHEIFHRMQHVRQAMNEFGGMDNQVNLGWNQGTPKSEGGNGHDVVELSPPTNPDVDAPYSLVHYSNLANELANRLEAAHYLEIHPKGTVARRLEALRNAPYEEHIPGS